MVAIPRDYDVRYEGRAAPQWTYPVPTFSERLRELRTKRGYTQIEVAARLSQYMKTNRKPGDTRKHNYSNQQVAEWEHGSQPRPDLVIALARVFGVMIDYILGLTDEEGSKLVEEGLTPEERELIQQLRLFPEQASLIYKALEIRRQAAQLPGTKTDQNDDSTSAAGPNKMLKG